MSLASQPKRSAPSRRQATRFGSRTACRLGIDTQVRCAPAARSGRSRGRRRARPSPTRARTSRGTRRAPASRTASGRRAREAMARATVWSRVEHACHDGGLLRELGDGRRLLDDVVSDRGQAPSRPAAEAETLDRRRAVPRDREHLLPRDCELDRPPGDARRQRGDDHVRSWSSLGAESAAHVRRDHTHLRWLEPESAGDRVPRGGRALGRVIQGEPIRLPRGDRRVRLHGIVVERRCLVRFVDDHQRRLQRGIYIACLGVRLEAWIDLGQCVERRGQRASRTTRAGSSS